MPPAGDHKGKDDDEDDVDSDDLEAILASMDIDKDFNAWTSFQSSLVLKKQQNHPPPPPPPPPPQSLPMSTTTTILNEKSNHNSKGNHKDQCPHEEQQRALLRQRLQRLELFSKHYHPSCSERQEINDLVATMLGLSTQSSTSFRRLLPSLFVNHNHNHNHNTHHHNNNNNRDATASGKCESPSSVVFVSDRERFEQCIQPQSVLLFRTFALLQEQEERDNDKKGSSLSRDSNHNQNNHNNKEVELILLTQGLVVAEVTKQSNPRKQQNGGHLLIRTFMGCITWDQVDHVNQVMASSSSTATDAAAAESQSSSSSLSYAFEIHFCIPKHSVSSSALTTKTTMTWRLTVATPEQLSAWMDALEVVLVRTYMHRSRSFAHPSSGACASSSSSAGASSLGWQYRLVHRRGFTEAVTGQLDPLRATQHPSSHIHSMCDDYNGLTMLHYAVRCGHAHVVSYLLEQCPTKTTTMVRAVDHEGHTPLYYARQDHRHDLQQLLMQHLQGGAGAAAAAERNDDNDDWEGGDVESSSSTTCLRGELFGAVDEAQQVINERRRREEEQREQAAVVARAKEETKKTKAARLAQEHERMNDNLRGMHVRGDKIQQMSSHASELNAGAENFADMAKQLKQKSQKPMFFGLL